MKRLPAVLACLFLALPARAADLPPLVLPEGVGVNIHFTRGHERDLDLIRDAGFKFVRMDFWWAGTERKKGEYDWSAYDELTANLERRGLRALYILDYSNGLYEEMQASKNPITGKEQRDIISPQHPESVAAFARWAAAAAHHYRGKRVIWEIWNEPNIFFWKPKPDVQQYTTLALATAKAIRAVDPGATIIGPATSEFPWEFLEKFFAAGALEHLDAVSVHPYRSRSKSPETAAMDYVKLRDLIAKHAPNEAKKNLPIISGEWGYSSHLKGVTVETQAMFLVRQQLSNLLTGIPLSIWYDWKNDGEDPAENEHNFGTVTSRLEPKPAYVAVQTLTRQLGGFAIRERLKLEDERDFALVFTNAVGAKKMVAWTQGTNHPVTISLGGFTKFSAVDRTGRPVVAARAEGLGNFSMELSGSPIYVELRR